MEGNSLLSQGLTSRLIASSGMPVPFGNGLSSAANFHSWPDGAACFEDDLVNDPGGWTCISNSEDM
jgi:hypothetical protein